MGCYNCIVMTHFRLTLFTCLCGLIAKPSFSQVPSNLVLDVRLFEARSTEIDFKAMESLRFSISTDSEAISHEQWLAMIANQAPDAFLAALSKETISVKSGKATWNYRHRSRQFTLDFNFRNYTDHGVFSLTMNGKLKRGNSVLETLSDNIELSLGRTFVFSNRDLEISIPNYISHFRDYEDIAHRAELFELLQPYNLFLVIALTPRLVEKGDLVVPMLLEIPNNTELPAIESPWGIVLQGTVILEFFVDRDGAPYNPHIMRSTVPELNPRLLYAITNLRFPYATGSWAQLVLDVTTKH